MRNEKTKYDDVIHVILDKKEGDAGADKEKSPPKLSKKGEAAIKKEKKAMEETKESSKEPPAKNKKASDGDKEAKSKVTAVAI